LIYQVGQLVFATLNAAAGFYVKHNKLTIGYTFSYEGKGTDLETIYSIHSKDGKPKLTATKGILKREFLYQNQLQIYTADKEIADYFCSPHYPLLLGRMNDLATVKHSEVNEVELTPIENGQYIVGQIIPLKGNFLAGEIQALPKYFTNDFPRNNIGTEPYSIISHQSKGQPTSIKAYRDTTNLKKTIDIYLHELDFSLYG